MKLLKRFPKVSLFSALNRQLIIVTPRSSQNSTGQRSHGLRDDRMSALWPRACRCDAHVCPRAPLSALDCSASDHVDCDAVAPRVFFTRPNRLEADWPDFTLCVSDLRRHVTPLSSQNSQPAESVSVMRRLRVTVGGGVLEVDTGR